MPKSILILSTAHPPDDGRVTHKVGGMLASYGFHVTWVGPAHPRASEVPGIQFVFYSGAKGRFGRLYQGRRLQNACLKIPGVDKVDVFFAVEPDSAEIAIRLARRFGARAVFDIHEMYHEEMLKRWVPRALRWPVGQLVKKRMTSLCRRADLSIGAGYTRITPYEHAAQAWMVLRHCLSRADMQGYKPHAFHRETTNIRIMHGKATGAHGTREVVRAVANAQRLLSGEQQLRLVCFNSFGAYDTFGVNEFRNLLFEEKAESLVDMYEPVPFREMPSILQSCDIGVIAYGREFGVNCMPNRIFEYMAFGMPVIVPNYSVEMTRILDRYPCGLAVDTENSGDIAEAIVSLCRSKDAAKMGEVGRRAALNELCMEKEIAPLISWIESISLPPKAN